MAETKNFRLVEKSLPEKIVLPKVKYSKDWNEDIVETAGFVPLEVRFKQMEQAGFQAQFFEQEFSSKDVRDMYLNHPEFDITAEDDIEDALEKIELRRAYVQSVKDSIRAKAQQKESVSSNEVNAKPKEAASEAHDSVNTEVK